jgi:hypothetical protein
VFHPISARFPPGNEVSGVIRFCTIRTRNSRLFCSALSNSSYLFLPGRRRCGNVGNDVAAVSDDFNSIPYIPAGALHRRKPPVAFCGNGANYVGDAADSSLGWFFFTSAAIVSSFACGRL